MKKKYAPSWEKNLFFQDELMERMKKMSKIADFYGKVMASPELQGKVANVLAGRNIADASDDQLKEIGEIAKSLGFDIDLEEAKKYISSDAVKVSDEALDAVAGGLQKGTFKCSGKNAGNKDESNPDISK